MSNSYRRAAVGGHFNEGARLTWEALGKANHTIGDLERAVDATRGLGVRWLYGDGKPGTDFRVKIEEAYGTPIMAWSQPSTAPFVVPALRDLPEVDTTADTQPPPSGEPDLNCGGDVKAAV